jgi:hypothetical protein
MRVVLLLALFSGAALAAPVDDMLRWAERLEQQGFEQLALMEWETLVQSDDVNVRAKALNAMLRAEHPNPLALRAAVMDVPEELIDPSLRSILHYERGWVYVEQGERAMARRTFEKVSPEVDELLVLRAAMGEVVAWPDDCRAFKIAGGCAKNIAKSNIPDDLKWTYVDLMLLLTAQTLVEAYNGHEERALGYAKLVDLDGRYASETRVFFAATQNDLRRRGSIDWISPEHLLTDQQLYGVGPDEARRPPGEAFGSAFWLGDDPDAAPLAVVYAADRLDAGDCDAVIQVAEGVQARWGETWRDLQQLTLTDPSRAWRGRGELEPAVLARLMEPRDLTRLEAAMSTIPAELRLVNKHSPDPFVDAGKLNDRRVSLQHSAGIALQDEARGVARSLEHVGTELGVAWAEALARAEIGACVIPPRP